MEPGESVAALRNIVGESNVLVAPADVDPYLHDWRKRHHGRTICVVRPRETAEVSALLRLASDSDLPVFPQGGNTSVCGGSVPAEDGRGIVVSLSRMNR